MYCQGSFALLWCFFSCPSSSLPTLVSQSVRCFCQLWHNLFPSDQTITSSFLQLWHLFHYRPYLHTGPTWPTYLTYLPDWLTYLTYQPIDLGRCQGAGAFSSENLIRHWVTHIIWVTQKQWRKLWKGLFLKLKLSNSTSLLLDLTTCSSLGLGAESVSRSPDVFPALPPWAKICLALSPNFFLFNKSVFQVLSPTAYFLFLFG